MGQDISAKVEKRAEVRVFRQQHLRQGECLGVQQLAFLLRACNGRFEGLFSAKSVAVGSMYVDPHCAAWAVDVFTGALAREDTGLALHARLHGWAVVPGPLQFHAWRVHTPTCHYKPAGGAITGVGRLHHIPATGAQLLRRPCPAAREVVSLVVPPRRSLRLAGQYQQATTAAAVVAASAAGRRLYPAAGDDVLRKAVNARVKTWAAAQDARGIDLDILAAQLAVRFGPSLEGLIQDLRRPNAFLKHGRTSVFQLGIMGESMPVNITIEDGSS